MDNKHILLAVIGIALIFSGNSLFKLWLNNQKYIRLAELSRDDKRNTIEFLKFRAEQETKNKHHRIKNQVN